MEHIQSIHIIKSRSYTPIPFQTKLILLHAMLTSKILKAYSHIPAQLSKALINYA